MKDSNKNMRMIEEENLKFREELLTAQSNLRYEKARHLEGTLLYFMN